MDVTFLNSEALQHLLHDNPPAGIWLEMLIKESGIYKSTFSKVIGIERQHLDRLLKGTTPLGGRTLANLRYTLEHPEVLENALGKRATEITPVRLPLSYLRSVPVTMIRGDNLRWGICANPKCGQTTLFTSTAQKFCSTTCANYVRHRKAKLTLNASPKPVTLKDKRASNLVACPACGHVHPIRGNIVRNSEPQAPGQTDHDQQIQVVRQEPVLPEPLLRGNPDSLQSGEPVPDGSSYPGDLHVPDGQPETLGNGLLQEAGRE